MSLIISDANILIDAEDGNLIPVIFRLPYEIAVPDILFEAELKEHHSHLLEMGLQVKSLHPESVKNAELLSVKYMRPSFMDLIALSLATQEQCPLLTGDKNLRLAAKNEGIKVHGTLWIVEQLLKLKLIEHAEAKSSFDLMKAKGSRLPWSDAEKIIDTYPTFEVK